MPSKGKPAKSRASEASKSSPQPTTTTIASATQPPLPPTPPSDDTQTVSDRAKSRSAAARPLDTLLHQKGGALSALSRQDQSAWLAARIASRLAKRPALAASATTTGGGAAVARLSCGGGPKTLKEAWKAVNELSLPLRAVDSTSAAAARKRGYCYRNGEGDLRVKEFEARWEKKLVLSCLAVESRCFRDRRERERRGDREEKTGEQVVVTEHEVFEETRRRREMAALRRELYGGGVGKDGKLATDPEWDDVEPVVLEEPEGALAAIAYPADYAEAMAYLRAVMQAKEYSERCLRLTEHIINMNPSHYTVWLYRAANVFALKVSIPDEIAWLNRVALSNLKNYQIWHHRHLLVENYFPTIASDPATLSTFAAAERSFLQQILSQDTKNYHVWSYRSYLVGKLNLFGDADELAAIEAMIDDDVRNNSAWSHRFFLVFSNPAHASPGFAATEADPKVPAAVVDREVEYAEEKIRLAPQNQSGWNYLRGVLVKGGRKLGSVGEFVVGFVKGLGEGEEAEDVMSTHALDLLAEIYAEKGDKEKADLSLTRLGQKWDRIRVGYWEWRKKCVEAPA
ncbi:protein prenylyltransferase [Parathielavia hyrcaniae]|uniref:Protein farnesyltransferase/geranylgeranyltransferase type-1 subunit alpha n=1 Tax=Parathielavia hyrcaniae TaxID=113614 RepID=A0AAN6T403_9PEZI|nr:protein prenylyltransferase [Parathielavia hyrcaniae]